MEEDSDLPAERETKDFQFKQLKKIRVFDSPDDLPRERSTLLAISNKYGLLFACGPTGLKIFHTKNVLVTNQAGENPNNIVGASPDIEVPLQLPVHHVALSADSLTLSLCMSSKDNGTFISFYDVRTLLNKSKQQKHAFAYHKLSRDSNSFVSDLKWNPGIPTLVAVCLSDGSISVLEVKDSVSQFAYLPASLGVTSACWSPKGKQLAVGKLDGSVVQYLPNLQEKKVIPCASFYSYENPVKVLDVLWLSTYAFTVVYAAADGSLETPPQLVVVLLPKKDERRAERFLNFTDTCFGSGERQHHYFLNFIEDWEILLGASATSIEVSVIAKAEDQVNWELWLLEDSGRAELPVTDNSDDTLPMGVVVDYTSQLEVFISEEKTLPPAPVLLILSTDGVLCPFQIINVNPRVKPVAMSLEQLSLEGGRQMQPLAALSVPSAASPAAAASPAVASLAFSLPTSVPASNAPSSFSFGTSAASAKIAPPPAYSFQPMQGSGTFGAVAAKPDIAASAPQTASPSIFTAAAASSVKVNLKDKFSALETAPALSSSVTMPTTFIPNSTKTLGEVASRAPSFPSLGSITAHKPNTPEVTQSAQKSARVNPPAAKQATATPQANISLQNQTKPLKDSDPVLTAIQEEITHFQKEMNELKNSTANSDFFLGKEEEKRQLRTETENLNAFVLDIKETTESLHGDVGTLKTSILESFASVQGAREENERKQDSRYRHLLYKKPLDPKSEAQMQEIRRLHQYVKFAVQDVNDVLDLEWDRYLQERKKQKGLVVPERETLFNTLANNLEIINQQKRRLNQLVDSLQKLRLYNQTSQWNTPIEESSSKNSFEVELESLRNALSKTTIEAQSKPLPKVPPKLSSVKQSQLRNFLTKRKTPPVRSLAPASLSRSSFLAPSYYEDLDDVSYTSSLSEAADTDDRRVAPQEIERQETPPPEPSPVRVPRHAPVARTVSIQPNFVSPSFGKPQLGPGPISSTPAPSAQSIRVIPQGADSTMLATKTVKHGAPTVAATQAAGAAALRRQMASQVPAPLTESTLQTVPQVVNVKELKGNGFGPTISTVLGPSVPHSAAQVIHQVLATVGSTQAKQGFPTGAVKMAPVPTSAHGTAAPSGLGAVSSKPAAIGHAAPVASALTTSSQITKAFQFSPAGSGFNFSNVSSGVSSSATLGSSKAGPGTAAPTNQTSQSPSFVFGPANKLVFGSGSESNFSYGSLKPASAPAPTLQPLQTPAVSSSTPTGKPETTATKSEDGLFQSFSGGETLGSFSGLRVGQAEEAPRAAATAQPAKLSSSTPMFSFTGVAPLSKPAEASSTTNSSATVLFGNAQTTSTGSSSLLFSKPSVVSSSTTPPVEAPSVPQNTTALSFGNLLNAVSSIPASGNPAPAPAPVTAASATFTVTSVPGHAAPSTTASAVAFLPSTPSLTPSAPVPVLAAPSSCTEVKQFVKPDKPHGDGSAQHQSPATLTSVQASAPLATTSISPLVTSVATAVLTQSSPVAESVASSAVPASAASNQNATITSSSIIVTPAAPAASTSSPQTAVIATAAPSPAADSSQVASVPADTATTGSAFVQTAASTPAAATTPTFGETPGSGTVSFGQAICSPANTVANTGGGFGAPAFGVAGVSGGFGQASFGQGPTFWKAPASSASNFSFTQSSFGSQPAFGQPPASTVVSSSGSLFGSSASTTSTSSFSFGQPTNSGTSTAGGGLFGQSSAPVFGQSSGFGQGASVFGSANSSTTTTSSSGFSFGQPSGFASNSSGSLFGQSQNSNTSVFGQPPSSSGGLFGSSGGTGSGGGGFFSGLGGKPSQEAANKNPFGATSPGFGSSNQSNPSSLFGNSGAKTFGFGSSSFGEQKSAGTFSAEGSVASQGFGFSSPAKTGGFGAAPVFGSPPTFGGSPGFGGVPAFGTAPAFSSPLGSTGGKVFGEGTAAANTGGFGFGSSTSNTTFGSLASQNTPTFGALSQQGTGFGAQSSGFSGFASGGAGTGTGSSGGFGFGSNQSSSTFGGGWRS